MLFFKKTEMKKTSIIILFVFSVIATGQIKKIKFVRGDYPSKNTFGWITKDSSKVARNIFSYRGGCCDMPIHSLMNAEVIKDTLYIDTAIETHSIHDNIGICGETIMLVIDTIAYPNYKKLTLSFKELKSTKTRKVPHIKG